MTTLKIIIINIKSSLSALPQISSDNRSNTYIHTLFKCYCKKKNYNNEYTDNHYY